VTELAKVSDALKPQPLVKSDRGIVCRVDAADHHMLSKRKGTRKQGLDKGAPDAGAAPAVPHTDEVLDRVTISRPCPSPLAKRGKAKDIAAGIGRLSKSHVAPEGDAPEFDQKSREAQIPLRRR